MHAITKNLESTTYIFFKNDLPLLNDLCEGKQCSILCSSPYIRGLKVAVPTDFNTVMNLINDYRINQARVTVKETTSCFEF